MVFDDSDVKIFSDGKNKSDSFDEISVIAEMSKHRANGNVDRAKRLGKHLAEIFIDEPQMLSDLEHEVGELQRDDNMMYQMKVLLVFTAEYCVNHYLSSPLLSNTAVNAMYDKLKKNVFDFYDRLDDAAEYSFYYLAVRNGVDIPANIGVSFAMLSGKDKDPKTAQLGTSLFEVARHEIEKIINSFNFED